MSQEFHVLRCFACNMYQVQQKKKSLKWQCKVCNGKQSLNKIYGEGSSAECRRHVQKLNMLRRDMENHQIERPISDTLPMNRSINDSNNQPMGPSKWTIFIEPNLSLNEETNKSKLLKENRSNDEDSHSNSYEERFKVEKTPPKTVTNKVIQKCHLPFANSLNNVTVEELDSVFDL